MLRCAPALSSPHCAVGRRLRVMRGGLIQRVCLVIRGPCGLSSDRGERAGEERAGCGGPMERLPGQERDAPMTCGLSLQILCPIGETLWDGFRFRCIPSEPSTRRWLDGLPIEERSLVDARVFLRPVPTIGEGFSCWMYSDIRRQRQRRS